MQRDLRRQDCNLKRYKATTRDTTQLQVSCFEGLKMAREVKLKHQEMPNNHKETQNDYKETKVSTKRHKMMTKSCQMTTKRYKKTTDGHKTTTKETKWQQSDIKQPHDSIKPQTSCFVGLKITTEKQNDLAITVRHKNKLQRDTKQTWRDATDYQKMLNDNKEEKQLHRDATRQQTDAKCLQMSRGVCSRFVFQIATQMYTLFCKEDSILS